MTSIGKELQIALVNEEVPLLPRKVLWTSGIVLVIVVLGGVWYFLRPEQYRDVNVAAAQVRLIAGAMEAYGDSLGHLPDDSDGLARLVEWNGFHATVLEDPWGQRLVYRCKSPCESGVVYSLGPNMRDDDGKQDDIVVPVARGRRH